MTDTKQKCQGCGAETMSDVGWCLACRSILYTDLQISKSDFRQTEFKTMVFPVRDVIWLQERVRLRDAEIRAMDTTNDEMGVTIATLRADLAEARADVQRFEAQLDAANRELAQARADVSLYHHANQLHIRRRHRSRRTIRALVVACLAIHRTLWQALDQYEVNDRGIVRDMRQHVIDLNIEHAKQSGQQAGE